MDNRSDGILVRQARPEDADAIVALEQAVWGPLGTAVYGMEHVEAWFETHPQGLMVAEKEGAIVGYHFSQVTHFDFADMGRFRDYDSATDHGRARKTHDPSENCLHCVTFCSTLPGAGMRLAFSVIELTEKLGRAYTLSLSRMSGFDAYMRKLENEGAIADGLDEESIALWYARASARAVGGKVWPQAELATELDLPVPKPDHVVSKHIRLPGAGLAAVLKGCMRDPQSRDYAALLVRRTPGVK